MVEGGNKSMMSPFLYFITTAFGAILACVFGYFAKKLIRDEEVSSQTAATCRVTMIIGGAFALVCYGAMPFITVPVDGFTLQGEATEAINKEGVTATGVMYCMHKQ